jgi:predicted O-methyltransferase YrrM
MSLSASFAFPEYVEKLKALNHEHACSDELGAFLALQTSTRIAGAFLDLTDQIPVSSAWIHSGLQDMSKLVTVGNEEALLQAGRDLMGFDLRVAFHRQDLHGFIEDMAKQKFDLIHCAYPSSVVEQAHVVHLLEMGGMAIFSHAQSNLLADENIDGVKLHKWRLAASNQQVSLVTKGSIIRRRRGGRNRNHG